MINLESYVITTKENFLDGEYIFFIKTEKTNKCIVIASYGLNKVYLVDYQGNKLANH
jgi:hypothetical protein